MNAITRRIARLATAGAIAVTALTAAAMPANAAEVTVAGNGTGSITTSCASGTLSFNVTQSTYAGAPNQSLYVQVYLYSYTKGMWYTAYAGAGIRRDNAGHTYTSDVYANNELGHGRWAAYATFYWYTTSGWVSTSIYSSYSQWSSSVYNYVPSSTCRI